MTRSWLSSGGGSTGPASETPTERGRTRQEDDRPRLLVMLTVLPTLLVVCGRWIFWPVRPSYGSVGHTRDCVWARIGTRISHAPRRIWVVTTLLLAIASLGILQLNAVGLQDKDAFYGTPESVVESRSWPGTSRRVPAHRSWCSPTWHRGAVVRRGALVGLAATGGVFTSAGLVLAGTFAVLGTLPVVSFAEIGIAVALGVPLDTRVVRSVLVTAINLDVRGRMWWPRALARRDHELDATTPTASEEAAEGGAALTPVH